jgi:hypothetical protein
MADKLVFIPPRTTDGNEINKFFLKLCQYLNELTDEGSTTLHYHDHTIYTPSSLTLTTGGTPVGTVAGVQTLGDGTNYQVPEVTGSPGFDVKFNFTSVTKNPKWLVFTGTYAGSASHIVLVGLWNYNTSAYVNFDTFPDAGGYSVSHSVYVGALNMAHYISSGSMIVRFYHVSSGNASHNVYFDYVALVADRG